MGHQFFRGASRARKWATVVGLIRGGADAAQIANATISTAETGLKHAANDQGLIEAVWLLTRLPLAARSDDFVDALRNCGLSVSETPSLIEIIGAVSAAIDARIPNCRSRSDFGELAQASVAETLSEVVGVRLPSLFDSTTADVQRELSNLATTKQFGIFAKDFFARFTNKCMDYFLSQILADQVGEGARFRNLAEQAEFSAKLADHCKQIATITQVYAGEWFSKHEWQSGGDITRDEAKGFTSYAMTKLIRALKQEADFSAN